jgi:hypothetical protein
MNLLYPRIPADRWLPMLGIGALGALAAGAYGILHDQITYTLSPEYFTHLKFSQFRWANLGLPPRFFVGEIGFLATWWVGFFGGWVLARVTAPFAPPRVMLRLALRGFRTMIAAAMLSGAVGYCYGLMQHPTAANSGIADFAESIGVQDVPAFVRVAYIHNGGYLGGLAGLVAAALTQRRAAKREGLRLEKRPSRRQGKTPCRGEVEC